MRRVRDDIEVSAATVGRGRDSKKESFRIGSLDSGFYASRTDRPFARATLGKREIPLCASRPFVQKRMGRKCRLAPLGMTLGAVRSPELNTGVVHSRNDFLGFRVLAKNSFLDCSINFASFRSTSSKRAHPSCHNRAPSGKHSKMLYRLGMDLPPECPRQNRRHQYHKGTRTESEFDNSAWAPVSVWGVVLSNRISVTI
jgi:hypothetical protein